MFALDTFLEISNRLRAMLWKSASEHPASGLSRVEDIVLAPPTLLSPQGASRISLWLYDVSVNTHVRDSTLSGPARNRSENDPIVVDLHYLVTPLADHPDEEQRMLALILHTVSGGILEQGGSRLASPARILVRTDSLETRINLWQSLRQAYRPGLVLEIPATSLERPNV